MAEAHNQNWPSLITTLLDRHDLTAEQAAWAISEVMEGNASPIALAGFLVALRAKGVTAVELSALADGMLQNARPINVPSACLDIVGTGGDRAFTVNLSTMAAIVIAACNVTVVKHGNRAASSQCGSADVLEALGVNLTLPISALEQTVQDVGIAFLFAQVFHPSMRHAAPARGGLGVPTVFNFLGPLTNPASPSAAAIGCADQTMAPIMAAVLAGRGVSALVFRGLDDGLDELAATGRSQIWQVTAGQVVEHVIDGHADLGLDRITVDHLRGGDAATNAAIARQVLAGQDGPIRQTVLFNAAAGLVADGTFPATATGTLVERFSAALTVAAEAIDSGAASNLLQRWVVASQAASRPNLS
ncbi:MAG: anthranilate phosphoribosyltransferase [Bifidobacteriaceae bacterium]|nr:anthranilate phosphoribosyltransferase [Bifidobacteriaceae bacterium]